MNKGISLHIGINNLSSHYDGSGFDNLTESIASAVTMQNTARPLFRDRVSSNYDPNALFADGVHYTPPTVDNVRNYVKKAADILRGGDMFLLTYAGHGSQIEFDDTPANEDGFDETWCLDDRQFFDDEILELFTFFHRGVRVLFISDSCHSGTLISERLLSEYLEQLREIGFDFENFDRKIYIDFRSNFKNIKHINDKYNKEKADRDLKALEELGIDYNGFENKLFTLPRVNSLSKVLADSVYMKYKSCYDELMMAARGRLSATLPRGGTNASIIQISACQDDQETVDGVFTKVLVDVLNNDNPVDYRDFHTKIKNKLNPPQVPIFKPEGNDAAFNERFIRQRPFTVTAP